MSGGDEMRGGAEAVDLGIAFDDRVSASHGDATDWKVLELKDGGEVTIQIWWDDPEIEATLQVRGEQAGKLAGLAHQEGARTDKLGPLKLPAGKTYIEIKAESGGSVYTLEVKKLGGGPSVGPKF
jgi:hypothetical protein